MNKSIESLNKKVWYRSLKVSFVGLFLLVLFGSNFGAYDSSTFEKPYSETIPKQTPEEMKREIAREYNPDSYYEGMSRKDIISEKIDWERQRTEKQREESRTKPYRQNYFYFLLLNIGIILSFELARRICYYIFLGSFIPRKTIKPSI